LEGGRRKEGEGDGRLERTVGPGRQRERRGGRAIGWPIRTIFRSGEEILGRSYSNWASDSFPIKRIFLIFKIRKENK